jgi:hypothetical protein
MALLMALAQEGFEQCKSTYAGRGTDEATSAMGRISDAWVASSPIRFREGWVLDIKGYEGCRLETGAVDLEQRFAGRTGGLLTRDSQALQRPHGGSVTPAAGAWRATGAPRETGAVATMGEDFGAQLGFSCAPSRTAAGSTSHRLETTTVYSACFSSLAAWEHEPSSSPHETTTSPVSWLVRVVFEKSTTHRRLVSTRCTCPNPSC